MRGSVPTGRGLGRLLALVLTALAGSLALAHPVEGYARTRHARPHSPAAAVTELLAVDRAFSAATAQAGGVAGFGAMFDPGVIMFAVPVPGFAHGRSEALGRLARALGGTGGRTEWAPIRGGISADGQQGFTFGYMTTRAEGQPARYAKYVSYWIRRPAGWQVIFFKRVPREEGAVDTALLPPALPARVVPVRMDGRAIEAARAGLDRRERAFSDAAQRIGLGPAFVQFGSSDAVNVGGGRAFTRGNRAIGESQGTGPSPLVWAPDGVTVASSGDLGVTWGMLRRTGPTPPGRLAEIPWFTIWRRAGREAPWLYVAE